jgi:transcriptional regulator with XRE-family HTH domain
MSNQTQKCDAQRLFAANMRRIRTAKHLTQEKVAEAAELHPNYISSVERGERNISICNIARIANALGVPMAELVAVQVSEAGTVMPIPGDTRNQYR